MRTWQKGEYEEREISRGVRLQINTNTHTNTHTESNDTKETVQINIVGLLYPNIAGRVLENMTKR